MKFIHESPPKKRSILKTKGKLKIMRDNIIVDDNCYAYHEK